MLGVSQWLVDLSGDPEPVQQYGQFASHGYERFPFGLFGSSTSLDVIEPPASEVCVWSEGAKDVLSSLNQEAAQQGVAGFGDGEFRLGISRVIVAAGEPQIGAHSPTRGKPSWIIHHETIRQGDHRPYSLYLAQKGCFWVALFTQRLNLPVEEPDLLRQMADCLKGRLQGGA
jgi:hypothetical protein